MDRPNERILIRITIGFLTALRASEASLRRPHQSLSINRQCAVFICRCTRRVTGRPAAHREADWDIYRRRGLLGSGLEDMWCEYLTETGWPDGTWILSSLPHSGIGDRVRTGEGVQWQSHSVIFRTTPHSQPCLSDDAALFFNFISQQIWVWVHTSVELISFYRRENTFSQGHWWLVEPVWWRWGVLLFMCPNLLQSLTCLTRALRDDGEIVRWTRESEDAVTDTLSQTWRVWRDWKWYILHWNTSWWTVDWQQVLKMELESRTRWSRCWK